jgi:hypothetical protein
MEKNMTVNDALDLADRIDSLIRRADTFGKSREDILEEVNFLSEDLKAYARQLDHDMEKELMVEAA